MKLKFHIIGMTNHEFNIEDENKVDSLKCQSTKMFQYQLLERRKFEECYERPHIFHQYWVVLQFSI